MSARNTVKKPAQERLMDATDERDELRRLLEACVKGWYGTAKGSGPVFAEARKLVATWNSDVAAQLEALAKPKPKPAPKPAKPAAEEASVSS